MRKWQAKVVYLKSAIIYVNKTEPLFFSVHSNKRSSFLTKGTRAADILGGHP